MLSVVLALGLAAVCIIVAICLYLKHHGPSFVDKERADRAVKKDEA